MYVAITENCVCCGTCEVINPEIFCVDTIARVNQDAVENNQQDCIDAALACPANAIYIDDIFNLN